jgi:trehalose 6-phosphate synthase
MNLVAKEYCICNYRQDGLLILSEFAGAAASLSPNAILVNPYDVYGVAHAIREGFYISREERSYRMQMLRKYIFQYDIYWWLNSFLEAAFYGWTQACPQVDSLDHLSKIEDLP